MTLSKVIQKIYIIHYKPLTERKEYLETYFKNNNIKNYEFRSLYQRENLTEDIKRKYFKLDNLNNAQICITIEHIETYREIDNISNNDNDWYLILEDDAIFNNNFLENINIYLNNIPEDAEYLDINDYMKINSQNLWEKVQTTRTNCSYLIKCSLCEKLLQTIIPFEKAIDHELNKQFLIHNVNSYWSNIPLISHGSISYYNSSYKQF